jgi:hypothetical protein
MPDPANRITVDNATVISGGVETSAATVHLIDRILVPPTVARLRQPARYPVPAIRTGGCGRGVPLLTPRVLPGSW